MDDKASKGKCKCTSGETTGHLNDGTIEVQRCEHGKEILLPTHMREYPRALPIVKYEGNLWYYDEKLNELRDYYTAEPRPLDSSGIEKMFFEEHLKKKPIMVFNCDDTNELPRTDESKSGVI